MKGSLTQGSILKNLLFFSLPFMLSSFLQTFYGLADLFIIGMFNGADSTSAVSMGSQVTHMLTVVIIGLAMGVSVGISRALGAKNEKRIDQLIANSLSLFTIVSIVLMIVLMISCDHILHILSTPLEAYQQAKDYLMVCFIGVPFIVFYNLISSIYRGLGDSKTPMYVVAIAGVINIVLDYLFIGPFSMQAFGAALATMSSQAISVMIAILMLKKHYPQLHFSFKKMKWETKEIKDILKVGTPISLQDGLIQVSFLTITMIANTQGVDIAASVGIVEKIIGFVFLVPSAMLSSVSAICAQCAGANLHKRAITTLKYAMMTCIGFGMFFVLVCSLIPQQIVALFTKESIVITMGATYLLSYIWDCPIAGLHFCFSGYFCAYEKSMLSFIHNIASIILMRIPGAYLASILFKDTLFPMGMAAPLGSFISVLICIGFYFYYRKDFKAS